MYQYKLIRSKRKTISLSIDEHCNIVVRAPMNISKKEIENMIQRHSAWLDKHIPIVKERMKNEAELTEKKIRDLTEAAKRYIPERVKYYADIMKVEPTGIKITSARKRFGSCSGKNSLCFSFRLMQYPPEAIDYVVVHELAHIKHHNHSADFYKLICKYMPDYREREKLLRGH